MIFSLCWPLSFRGSPAGQRSIAWTETRNLRESSKFADG
jgi:hypothetical protein